jgi:hypothetical protein
MELDGPSTASHPASGWHVTAQVRYAVLQQCPAGSNAWLWQHQGRYDPHPPLTSPPSFTAHIRLIPASKGHHTQRSAACWRLLCSDQLVGGGACQQPSTLEGCVHSTVRHSSTTKHSSASSRQPLPRHPPSCPSLTGRPPDPCPKTHAICLSHESRLQ